jgi:hypothetical protein
MRAAAVPANAGDAGAYDTSRTPKSAAALDKEETRKPNALGKGSLKERARPACMRAHEHENWNGDKRADTEARDAADAVPAAGASFACKPKNRLASSHNTSGAYAAKTHVQYHNGS